MTDHAMPAAEWVATDSIHAWSSNPRNNDAAVPRVAESITRLGWGAPIVAQLSTRRIIAGHTRWKAAQSLGLDQVPVRFVDVDDAKADAMSIADNKLGEIATWEGDELAEILQSLAEHDLDHGLLGFDDGLSLEALIEEIAPQVGEVPWDEAFGGLPVGAPEYTGMTFTLTHDQKDAVEAALQSAKGLGPFPEGNSNSNGNALARICELWAAGSG